jgi:peroxiredoxin
MAPVLDEALNELEDADRQVVLLRFFDGKSMRELGQAFGITEDAAKMRVSRAVDRLRTRFSGHGVTCGAAALGALLTERAVEAAPAALVVTLAALQVPVAAGLGAGGLTGLLLQSAKVKLVAGLAAAVVIGAATILLLRSPNAHDQASPGDAAQSAASTQASGDTGGAATTATSDTQPGAAANNPDPRKLLQGLARARQRISSGELEFQVATYHSDRAFEGTNVVRLKALFDDANRRFESFGREYSYASTGPDAAETTDARMQAEGLDQEAAVRAGLLEGFDSHHVAAYDGSVFLDYWTTDDKPFQAKIDYPAKGGSVWLFDPRCLGIDPSPNVRDTIESCLRLGNARSVQLVGNESVAGVSAWHIRVQPAWGSAEFWLAAAQPTRVLKHTFNGSQVWSRYDDENPKDPIPTEVTALTMHGGAGRQTFTETRIIRTRARFNLPVDPASFTLAGLGMKTGTSVVDYRISRQIGYWTGTGLSDNLPRKTADKQTAPDRAALLALLDHDPASPSALDAAQRIIFNTPDGPDVEKAAAVILSEHIRDTNLVHLSLELERLRHGCSSNLLVAMLDQNPQLDIRGNACFSLATIRQDQAKFGKNQAATAEAVSLFERVIADFGQVKRNGQTLADLAKPELSELRRLIIGQPAPEIEGEDLDGAPMKLSAYRGQVVVLVFWGHCGGCRPEVSEMQALLERTKGKGLSILGVYCDNHPDEAKAIAEKIGMTWPSFKNDRNGPISTAWNVNSWPRIDVLDRKGAIRYRQLYGGEIARAAESLLSESP